MPCLRWPPQDARFERATRTSPTSSTPFESLRETRTHLRVAAIYDLLETEKVREIDEALDRVAAMTCKRIRARRR